MMAKPTTLHYFRLLIAFLVILILSIFASAQSSELAPGWRIISAEEILSECRSSGDDLSFTDRSGEEWELITDATDPDITNPGEFSFYPMSESVVRSVILELAPEIRSNLACTIYILPYPRRGLVRSSCDGRAIYLSPGVRQYSPPIIHCILCHEVGHLVHRQLVPKAAPDFWPRYRRLRGLENCDLFHTSSLHGNQPEEIFAEDFRKLFGTPVGRVVQVTEISSAPAVQTRSHVKALIWDLFRTPIGRLLSE